MLELKNLTYKVGHKTLIENISLNFIPGFIYGIIGPNGAGKSTLLKTLTGIWKATTGKVYWKHQELLSQDRTTISRTLSLVLQNPQPHFAFSVAEMVEMGTYPRHDLRKKEKKAKVQWALELVNGWHLRDERITEVSQGERQRIYIARSLVTQSPILVLDEPTSNLDIKHQLEIWNLLRRLSQEGKLIIVANHDLYATERFCDQVAVLKQGCLYYQGAFAAMKSSSLLYEVFEIAHL
ncbi:Hemin import ATP-binding protein HmuV [Neochlamydia sp. EPS4]|uniref:ABC transporter ATP-binding protein n=1 Tax=Neochlamydia sp. EPS4 TaxID=1478175 RepID=UPI0005834DC4|nr:ABC transporter ATP-binding protein [Neochlamydia sp. EPS4]KIC73050.1 Hemin import ATP-binding protein HmuV [Neochlamydia sp. EPS4]